MALKSASLTDVVWTTTDNAIVGTLDGEPVFDLSTFWGTENEFLDSVRTSEDDLNDFTSRSFYEAGNRF